MKKTKGMRDQGLARVRAFNATYKDKPVGRDAFIRAAADLFCHRGGLRRSKDYTVKAGGQTLRVCALELHHEYRGKLQTHKFLAVWDSSTRLGVVYDEVTVPHVLRHHLLTPEVAASARDKTFIHAMPESPVAANDDAPAHAEAETEAAESAEERFMAALREELGPAKGHEMVKVPGLFQALQKLCNGNTALMVDYVLRADAFQHEANQRPRLMETSSDVMRLLVRNEQPRDVLGELEEKLRPRLEHFHLKGLADAGARHQQIRYG